MTSHNWQSMASAPKDGTEFLAWFPKHRINEDGDSTDEVVGGAMAIIAYTEANGWDEPQWLDAHGAYYMDDWCFADEPTLWHPLPDEPAAPGVKGEGNG